MTAVKRPAPPPPVTDQALLRSYFDRVDKNSNGFICAKEFQSALTNEIEDFPFQIETVRATIRIEHSIWKINKNSILKRFVSANKNEISFNDFIRYCLILHGLTKEFQSKDDNQVRKTEITIYIRRFLHSLSYKVTY